MSERSSLLVSALAGRWAEAAIAVGTALLLLLLVALPLAVDDAAGEMRVHFEADHRAVLLPGDCVTVRWQAEGIREVTLGGEGVAGTGERAVCVESGGEVPALCVTLQSGAARVYRLPVGVAVQSVDFWAVLGAAGLLILFTAHLRSLSDPETAARRAAAGALLTGAGLAALLAPVAASRPVVVDRVEGETALVRLEMDRPLLPGGCFDIRWDVEGIQTIQLDGVGVAGSGEQRMCKDTWARIVLRDGTDRIYPLHRHMEHHALLALAVLLALLAGRLAPVPGLSRVSRWLLASPLAALSSTPAGSGIAEKAGTERRSARRRALRLALAGLVILLPALVTILLVTVHLRASLLDFVPRHSDEVYYWRQILTFSAVGFDGGYYTYNEFPAQAAFSHFGTWGPMLPILYGTAGRIAGWELYSGPIFNVAVLGLGLAAFIGLVRPDAKQVIGLGVIVLTCWPVLFYAPTNMQESLNQALGMVMAGLFYRLIARREGASWAFLAGAFLVILLASLLRTTWSFVYVPFFVLLLRPRTVRGAILALVAGGAMIAASYAIYYYWMAPYPYNIIYVRGLPLADALGAVAETIRINLDVFLRSSSGTPLEIFQRVLLLTIAAVSAALWAIRAVKRRRAGAGPTGPGTTDAELLFHAYNLASVLAFNVVLYNFYDWRDYRLLALPLLLTCLLLVAFRRLRAVTLIGAGGALLVGTFMTFYFLERQPNFTYDHAALARFEAATGEYLAYEENADPWCNTLLTSLEVDYRREFLALPPGMGLSVAFEAGMVALPPRSRYLLLDEALYDEWRDQLDTALLTETDLGNLYLNLDADCE